MLGTAQAGAQPATGMTAPIVPPQLEYAALAADERPAGGNVSSTAVAAPANDDQFNPASDEGALTVLGVTVNGREVSDNVVVTVRDGRTLVPADALKQWRLHAVGPVVSIDGQEFLPITAVAGLSFTIDKQAQLLQLTVPVTAFERTTLMPDRETYAPSSAARSAFLNYDVLIQHAGGELVGSAVVETGISDARGLIDNTMVLTNKNGEADNIVRLDTFAIHDDPSGLTRLRLGDAFTSTGSWGTQVRFGGIKWGTDFSLQPGFLSFPTPSFAGEAAVPSSVQLYVNDVLNFQGHVDQGPFALNRLPVVTGAGDVSVVVKDQQGIERRITSRYYISNNLLRPGLSQFSVEAGAARYNFGQKSFDYRQLFASGLFRHGLTSSFTGEVRGELSRNVQDAGVGLATLVGKIGEIGGAVAVSHSNAGTGLLYRAYAARVDSRFSFSLTYERSTRDFTQIGFKGYTDRPLETLQAAVGVSSRRLGSLTAGQSYLRLAGGERTRISSINYNRQLGRLAYVGLFALHSNSSSGGTDNTVGGTVSIPLGPRRSVFAQVDTDGRHLQLQQNIPDDTGWGYRLAVDQGDQDQQQADVQYRGHAVDAQATISHTKRETAERLIASGGLILSGRSILPTRRVNDSFAIIDVGHGEKGVRVFQENRQVAITNGAGKAVITNLRPYEANRLAVAPNDLRIDSTITNDTLLVVPRYLAGVYARFRVNGGRAGTVVILLPDGSPLEAGLSLTYGDGSGSFYSGFDGEVFIDDISEGKVLIAKRETGPCQVSLPAVPKDVVLPRIGPLTCKSIEAGR